MTAESGPPANRRASTTSSTSSGSNPNNNNNHLDESVVDQSARRSRRASDGAKRRSSVTSSTAKRGSLQHKIDLSKLPPVYKIPLWELNCQFGMVKKKSASTVLLMDAVQQQRKSQQANCTVVFAIRQAGWAGCREHGRQLTELAAEDPKIALMATVKDTGGTDLEGLLEFHQDYFGRHAIYQDDKWQLYKAMNINVGLFALFKGILGARKRYKEKGIQNSANNMKAREGWMAGGVLVFDKQGELVFVLEENPGEPMDMERLQLAIDEARSNNRVHKKLNSSNGSAELNGSSAELVVTDESSSGSEKLIGPMDRPEETKKTAPASCDASLMHCSTCR